MANRTITALLEHKFDLSMMESFGDDEYCHSPVMSIVHNNVNLSFHIAFRANDTRDWCKNYTGLYIRYVDGPTNAIQMRYALFVAKGSELEPACIINDEEWTEFKATNSSGKCSGFGENTTLPGTLDGLRHEGYLCQDSLLTVFAILFIPEDAFKDPKNKCPASSAQNPFRHHLYLEIGTPTATNLPSYNRFEIISNDSHHFWVHKDVLAFNSDAFQQMLDPEKPEDARFDYLREGRMTLKKASGGAVKEMFTYLYLQHTTPEFDKFAMELVSVAEMYRLKGLALLCLQTLVVQARNETDVDPLLHLLEFAQLHKLTQLEDGSVKRLGDVLNEQHDVDRQLLLVVTELAHKHNYTQLKTVCQRKLVKHVNECGNLTVAIIHGLATEAEKYGMNELSVACGQWLTSNWEKVSKNGQLSDMIEDKTGGLFARLMTLALKKN